ncbi:MAG: TolC family protein [Bacteroidetes bacterium]|nr:TolC family protein [Bacteroidota bacterium]
MTVRSRTILLLLLAVLAHQIGVAQPLSTLSYDEAIRIALHNNPDLQARALNVRAADHAIDEARTDLLPSVNLSYDLQRNLIIPVTPVPAAIFDPTAPSDAITPLRFATGWMQGAGVLASFNIFDPATYRNVAEKKIEATIRETDRKITQLDVESQVGLAYTDCVIAQEQVRLAVADTVNSAKILRVVQDRSLQGRALASEVQSAMIDANNARSRLNEAVRVLRSSEEKLLYTLGYASQVGRSVTLTDSIPVLYARFASAADTIVADSASLTYLKSMQQGELTETQQHYTALGFLPTVTLNGFYGANYYNNSLTFFDATSWYGNSYLQLSVRVPLTADLQRSYTLSKLAIQRDVDQQNLAASMNKRRYELERARADHAYYMAEYTMKRSNAELAQRSFDLLLQQYAEGRVNNSELSRSEFTAQQARVELLRSAYNFIQASLSVLRLRKS